MLKGGPHTQSVFMVKNGYSVARIDNLPDRVQSGTLLADLIHSEWRMSSANEMTLASQMKLQVPGLSRSCHIDVERYTKVRVSCEIWLRRQRRVTLLINRAFITK